MRQVLRSPTPRNLRAFRGGESNGLRIHKPAAMVDRMQDEIQTFRQLIECWPSKGQFGRDVAGDKDQGRIFYRRNRVPRSLHQAVVDAAAARGLEDVTMERLAALYERGRGEGR